MHIRNIYSKLRPLEVEGRQEPLPIRYFLLILVNLDKFRVLADSINVIVQSHRRIVFKIHLREVLSWFAYSYSSYV